MFLFTAVQYINRVCNITALCILNQARGYQRNFFQYAVIQHYNYNLM